MSAIAALLLLAGASSASASSAGAQWRVASPPGANAWYAVLDSLRLAGDGPLPLTRSAGRPIPPLGTLLADQRYDLLHFLPLYYPSASRAALADGVEDAAGPAAPRAARAQFLVAAVRQALPDVRDRRVLVELAGLTRRAAPAALPTSQLSAWQAVWTGRFAPALARFLADERLDGGVLLVVPALGPEGRVFAGLAANRTDNLVAVGAPLNAADADGPLYAAVRELCFPLVSRLADAHPDFRRDARTPRNAARRSSLAAVRCGADLLDHLLPAEAAPYRLHWRAAAGDPSTSFDALFPPDPVLAAPLRAALQRYAP